MAVSDEASMYAELRGQDGSIVWSKVPLADDEWASLLWIGETEELLSIRPGSVGGSFDPAITVDELDPATGARPQSRIVPLQLSADLRIDGGFCFVLEWEAGMLVCDQTNGWPLVIDLATGAAEPYLGLEDGIVTIARRVDS